MRFTTINVFVTAIALWGNAECLRADDLRESNGDTSPTRIKWALVVHGGAGTVPADAPVEQVRAYRAGLTAALTRGKAILDGGGTSLDAVEDVIRVLEDDELFNAGKGAVFNSAGGHELDASIMDGQTMDGGAVAGVVTVKNPIRLARRVMEHTRHVLLAGPGAESFATEQKVDRVANESFSTELRRTAWKKVRDEERRRLEQPKDKVNLDLKTSLRFADPQPWQYGTVGCVALDSHGNIAAGTSTGGLTNKKFGRVGDSPILGAGTYADNATCGISASGVGEQFMRHAAAAQISLLMQHRQWSLRQAAEYVLTKRLRKGDGGIIGIDSHGAIVWVYTTPGMFRAATDANGKFVVRIRDEE
ncbi:MAG: isoaspartyl peptidase/L-asparaginase [Planctomycetota bacterium]|nr:isoaspartyl peptidase/L-asparaginase [Planctomycetota bacterium]